MEIETIKLTEYSHGAGCGCKISPKVLDSILHSEITVPQNARLLVGNNTRDDAAVYDIGNGKAIISTTDFFMPIVDDPFDFGQIAAANAISDIYAMGGNPMMAIAILGWPINKIPAESAQKVLEGGRNICTQAGIPLAGGHSIDSPEPIFGLAVTGMIDIDDLKKNNSAEADCLLFLTKPLGVGILSTAQKQKKLLSEHIDIARDSMIKLNNIGAALSKIRGVLALTDVTGFGLLGHLSELCEASNLQATLFYDKIPVLPHTLEYLDQQCVPGGTNRNWDSYGHKIGALSERQKQLLCDPQTSGGLLVAVRKDAINDVIQVMTNFGISENSKEPIGILSKSKGPNTPLINVN